MVPLWLMGVWVMEHGIKQHPKAWLVVFLCMLAYIFSFIDRQILSLLIGPIQADLGISDTQFGLLHGLAFSIFYATMGLPIATLSDRMSRPVIIVAGLAFWSLATAGCGLARGFIQLFIARVCVGAGEAALAPATYSLITDLFPARKLGQAIGVFSLGSFLGSGLAFIVGGSAIAAATAHGPITILGILLQPWQMVLILVGLPGLLLAAIIALTVREPHPSGRRPQQDAEPFSAVVRFLRDQKAIFLPHMTGYTMAAMALFTILGWSPAYLMRTFDLKPVDIGLSLGLIAVFAGGGGVITSGLLMDWLTRRGHSAAPFLTGMVGAAGTVIPAALLPLAHSLPAAITLVAATQFFASFPMPPSTAAMQLAAPPRMRSRVTAIFLCSNSLLGLALGSAIVGVLNDHVFGSPTAVGKSIAIVIASSSVLACLILSRGVKPFQRFIAIAA